jgi:hypothetical protein
MTGEFTKSEILRSLMTAAAERWGAEEVERMKPSLEVMAEAIWNVGSFRLMPEEEPATMATMFHQTRQRAEEKPEER